MKRKIEYTIAVLGLISIGLVIFYDCRYSPKAPDLLKVAAVVAAFDFFMYKLITGWLFINLSIKIETERKTAGADTDDLLLKLTFSKGNIDSVWIRDIQVRLSEANSRPDRTDLKPLFVVRPIGFKKRGLKGVTDLNSADYWNGEESKSYVISVGEDVPFSAYARVPKDAVIAAEVLVLGIRPFYGLERRNKTLIQWRASAVVLPVKDA